MFFEMFFFFGLYKFLFILKKVIYIVPGLKVDFDLVLYIKVYSRFETDR